MAERRHYPNPPITEALIDLRVEPDATTTLNDLRGLETKIGADYPTWNTKHLARGQIPLSPELRTSASSKPIGFICKSADEKWVFQPQLEGFTLSRLAPYERWELLRDEARRLWQLYREVARPRAIVRVAVRYINRIDLPLPAEDLKEFLLTVPEIAQGLPQHLAGFLMQVTLPMEDIQSTALISEVMIEPAMSGVASIVLDFDLFRTAELPNDGMAVWDVLDLLHARENELFEGCITDKTREMFH